MGDLCRGSRDTGPGGVDHSHRDDSSTSQVRNGICDGNDGSDSGPNSVNAIDDYTDTVTDALAEPPMWELCTMCNDRPHSIKDKGSLYCWACYGDICAAERAQPWERCSVCEDKPGVRQQGGSWFCKECYGEACAAEKKHSKVMPRGKWDG